MLKEWICKACFNFKLKETAPERVCDESNEATFERVVLLYSLNNVDMTLLCMVSKEIQPKPNFHHSG